MSIKEAWDAIKTSRFIVEIEVATESLFMVKQRQAAVPPNLERHTLALCLRALLVVRHREQTRRPIKYVRHTHQT
jgi:hypothetical protein